MDPDMRLGIQMTHSKDCYRWHHECAVVKVDALRARIGDVAGMAFVIAEDYCPVGMPTIVSPVDINVARAVSAWLKEGK